MRALRWLRRAVRSALQDDDAWTAAVQRGCT
ncbi:hypothetical protein TSHO111613_22010 [Tsukamurella hominis]